MSVEIEKSFKSWEWNIFIDGHFVGFISKYTGQKVGDQHVRNYTVFALTNAERNDAEILFASCTHDDHLNKTGGGLGVAKKWVRDNLSNKEDFMAKVSCAQPKELEKMFDHG